MVFGHGLDLPIAHRLAEKMKRVIYCPASWETAFSSLKNACVGSGYEDIEHCGSLWDQKLKPEIDLYVICDIHHAEEQLELESQGKAVWGSRRADELELDREKFLEVLAGTGLDVPIYTVVQGVENLRIHLKDKEDKYIKIGWWRGDFETCHWQNWIKSREMIDAWAFKFGPLQDTIRFIVLDPIETDLEIGCDTYCVDGRFPNYMLHGLEAKDKAYFSAVTETDEMPDQIGAVLEAFGPIIGKERYRNQISTEIRVKDDKSYYLDPTHRLGLPSTASQLKLWKNFPEIVWAGANGELVDPEFDDEFSMEISVSCKSIKDGWTVAEVPKELEPHLCLMSCCKEGEVIGFPPDDSEDKTIGWLVATGKTPRETLETLKGYIAGLPKGMSADCEPLEELMQEAETAEEQGVPFTDPKDLPEPEEVIA